MKNNDSFESDDLLEEHASAWLIECADGFAPDRAVAFADWCKQDPRHAAAVARVEQSLALLDAMPAVRAPLEASFNDSPPARITRSSRANVLHRGWTWAAGLAAACVIGVVAWNLVPRPAHPFEDYAADSTAAKRLALSDGSVVDLNANSHLQVEFLPAVRQMTLTEGEAHFRVAHDTAHPFIVNVKGIAVRAVGTAFNVKLDGDQVEVIVTEGRVTVERQHAAAKETPLLPILAAGERTRIADDLRGPLHSEKIAPEAVRALLAWQDRMTRFTNVPLREMVARINRCNATQLVLGDPEIGDQKIGGVIALNQVDAFVHLLEQDGDIVADYRSSAEIVLRRAR